MSRGLQFAASAGDMGSVPDRRIKIPHSSGQLSLHTTTREPACCSEDPVQQKIRRKSET